MIRLQTQYVRCSSFFTERETQQKTVLRHKLFILVHVPTFIRSQDQHTNKQPGKNPHKIGIKFEHNSAWLGSVYFTSIASQSQYNDKLMENKREKEYRPNSLDQITNLYGGRELTTHSNSRMNPYGYR